MHFVYMCISVYFYVYLNNPGIVVHTDIESQDSFINSHKYQLVELVICHKTWPRIL